MPSSIPKNDLTEIVSALSTVQTDLKQAKIFLSGGTGFFGIWLIESFLTLNQHYSLNAELFILSRDPKKFLARFPGLHKRPELKFVTGDIRDFKLEAQPISHVIHAATSANNDLIENHALEMLDIITNGTKHLLDYCSSLKTKPKILLTSSGAVYGTQNNTLSHIPETETISPNLYGAHGAYAVGKCMAEHLCYQYHRLYGLPIKIARCFAFVGPHLPLEGHFAIGNFIADALAHRPITVKANRPVFRSYQYPSDLMIWLWTILIKGESAKPYNVGSNEDKTLAQFAELIANQFTPSLTVNAAPLENEEPSRYVPSIDFAKNTLGLYNRVPIQEALARTIAWHQL